MIPILYKNIEKDFVSNGLGGLSEATKCEVREERNGEYELEMEYPVSGSLFSEIKQRRIIYAIHDDNKDKQPFRIYRISKPINGVITINARHISYDLAKTTVSPFTATTLAVALSRLKSNVITGTPFTFWTDKVVTKDFKLAHPEAVRSVLGGIEGSILDTFGSMEFEWDHYQVKLWTARGADNGVQIRYGKNLTELEHVEDSGDSFTGVVPYWVASDGNKVVALSKAFIVNSDYTKVSEVYLNEDGIPYMDQDGNIYEGVAFEYEIVPLDLSADFETAPTAAQLEGAARSYIASSQNTVPDLSLTISFVNLWETNEYKDIAPLEHVKLCDTIQVLHEAIGVNAKAKVVEVVYDALRERYISMTIGEPKTTLSAVVAGQQEKQKTSVSTVELSAALNYASSLITGGLGGHVVINRNEDGEPNEILVMDTPDIGTAVNVIRINEAGIAFSTSGYDGPFNTAWTIDGTFIANYIQSGIISDEQGLNTWNLDTGELSITGQFNTNIDDDGFGIVIDDGELICYRQGVRVGTIKGTELSGDSGIRAFVLGADDDAEYVAFGLRNSSGKYVNKFGYKRTEDCIYCYASYFTMQNKRILNMNPNSTVYQRGYLVYGINNSHTYQIAYSGTTLWFYVDEASKYYLNQSYSDKRLKKYIKKINSDILDKVLQIEIKQFVLKEDETERPRFGVIAQDVQEVLGEEDNELIVHAPDSDILYVDNEQFLYARLAANERRIAELEAKIEKLEQMLTEVMK